MTMHELRSRRMPRSRNGHVAAQTPQGTVCGVTLEEALEQYLAWHHLEGHSTDTIRAAREKIGAFLRWAQEAGHAPMRLEELSVSHIMAYLAHVRDLGLAAQTLRSRYGALHAWLEWAVGWGYIAASPMARLTAPRVARHAKPFVSAETFQALLACCPLASYTGARRASMLWVLATTGIRHNELWLLEVSDIDWRRALIVLPAHKAKGRRRRLLPLQREAQRALFRYLEHRRRRDRGHSALWLTEEGVPLSYWGISRDLRQLAERAGVSGEIVDICHAYRRTLAAASQRQRLPMPYIMAVMGWETPEMVQRYSRWMEQEESAALETFRQLDVWGKQ